MRLLVNGCSATMARLSGRYGDCLGHLYSPACGNALPPDTGLPWAVDNGAYSGLDTDGFMRLLRRAARQPGLLWVVCPDVVGDAAATLEMFNRWLPSLRSVVPGWYPPVAFVGQDGAESIDIPWSQFSCWFVGGTDRWKLSQASRGLVADAKRRGKVVHMGRVNSLRRIQVACMIRCDSVDGTSMSRFGDTYIEKFCQWARYLKSEGSLFADSDETGLDLVKEGPVG